MKRCFVVFLLSLLLFAISHNKSEAAFLDKAKQFLKSSPEAAYSIVKKGKSYCSTRPVCMMTVKSAADGVKGLIRDEAIDSAAKWATTKLGQVGAKKLAIAATTNADKLAYKFLQDTGKILSPHEKVGYATKQLAKGVLKNTRWAGKALKFLNKAAVPAISIGMGAWDTYKHIEAGDYRSAVQSAAATATGLFVTAGCIAAGVATAGLGLAACTLVAGVAVDLTTTYVAGKAYDMVNGNRDCVHEGFRQSSCSSAFAEANTQNRLIAAPEAQLLNAANQNRLKSPGNRTQFGVVPTGGIVVGRGVDDNSPMVTTRNLNSHIRVGRDVTTVAPTGSDTVTRIGSTGIGTGEVGGTHVTAVGGTVYNKGGQLEINPIQGCSTRRNGKCCIEIHRTHCVINKYKRSKKYSECNSGYEKAGKYCYQYADKVHGLSR